MPSILTLAFPQDGTLPRAALEVLTRARTLAEAGGLDTAVALIGADAGGAADLVAKYGATRVYVVESDALAQPLNKTLLAAVEQVAKIAEPVAILMPASERTKDILGALAVRLDAAALPDIVAIDLADGLATAERPVLAGKVLEQLRAERAPAVATLRAGSYAAEEAASPTEPHVQHVGFDFDASSLAATLREVASATGGAIDLAEASAVVSAGRGVRDEEGKRLVEELAQALNAAVGASRAVVESGLFPASAQIGQTGKVVAPELYVGVGISGAIQHVAGMTGSRVIVAINKDADAPLFKIATIGLVGDLYAILPQLTAALRSRG